MRFSAIAMAAAALCSSVHARWTGMNVGANNPDGSCKSPADWLKTFQDLKTLPIGYNSVRLYSTADCNQLVNAVPVAKAQGIKILVGVWADPADKFEREFDVLKSVVRDQGSDWMAAVSVGSEDLYRKKVTAPDLAARIRSVRGALDELNAKSVDVGHVDTWSAFVDPANAEVIRACQFVGHDSYPYWQGATPDEAANVFWMSVQATKVAVSLLNPNAKIWITEMGWPVSGDNFGASKPSVDNAGKFFKKVGCPALRAYDTWYYAYQDYNAKPSFGIFGQNGKPLYDTSCGPHLH